MKKIGKKTIIGIIMIVVGVIGASGSLLGAALVISIGILLICIDIKASKKRISDEQKCELSLKKSIDSEQSKKIEIPDGQKNYNLLPDYFEGNVLCYQYEKEIAFINDESKEECFNMVVGNGGKQLLFEFEPDNQYDGEAVAIILDDKKIGYVYKGQTQDMIHSYVKKGWEIAAHINKYNIDEKKATYKIGFYKPLNAFESKQYSLVKTTKRIDEYSTRTDNISSCNVGEFLTIESDFDDKYIVMNESYEEIGELPQTAINFIEENGYEKLYGIISELEEDENGKYKVKIKVYFA